MSDRRIKGRGASGVFTQQGLPSALRTVSPRVPVFCAICGHTEDRTLPLGEAIAWRLAHATECPGPPNQDAA